MYIPSLPQAGVVFPKLDAVVVMDERGFPISASGVDVLLCASDFVDVNHVSVRVEFTVLQTPASGCVAGLASIAHVDPLSCRSWFYWVGSLNCLYCIIGVHLLQYGILHKDSEAELAMLHMRYMRTLHGCMLTRRNAAFLLTYW